MNNYTINKHILNNEFGPMTDAAAVKLNKSPSAINTY